MRITRISEKTGRMHTREVDATRSKLFEQVQGYWCVVEEELNKLPKEQQRFINTGITVEEDKEQALLS